MGDESTPTNNVLISSKTTSSIASPNAMSCCCGGDSSDDPLLLPNNSKIVIPSETLESTVLSPMNSNFSSLSSNDILRSILELLPPPDLARAACVCRLWRAVASDRDLMERAFGRPWNVRRLVGSPSSGAFWRSPGLDRFSISHRLQRGDTVAGLALKYSVQVMDIKRLNNMMSEHGIYSRERLLIPISSSKQDLLSDSTCYIELDAHAKREVAVLYLDENGCPQVASPNDTTTSTRERRGRRILVESVKRSMHVDDGTAEYYLSVSNGDPRAAILHLSEDLEWEQQRASRQ